MTHRVGRSRSSGRPSPRVRLDPVDAAISVLAAVPSAPITRTIRSISSEVELGPEHGLPERLRDLARQRHRRAIRRPRPERAGQLDEVVRAQLDRALRYALDIIY